MKKVIVFGLLAGATSIAFPQGHITLDNFENANNSPTASSNGKFFFFDGGCNPAYLANHDFNISFYGGSDANSLVLLKTFAGATAAGGNVLPGIFYDLTGTEVTIPGATTTAFFRIEAWTGSSPTFGGVNYGIDLGGAIAGL